MMENSVIFNQTIQTNYGKKTSTKEKWNWFQVEESYTTIYTEEKNYSWRTKEMIQENGGISTDIIKKIKEIISTFGRECTPRSSLLTGYKLGKDPIWEKKQQQSLIMKKKFPFLQKHHLWTIC